MHAIKPVIKLTHVSCFQGTLVNMGILGTDYTLRSGHAIFLILAASSVLLGFSYLNEMYQRIQLQVRNYVSSDLLPPVTVESIVQKSFHICNCYIVTNTEHRNTVIKW